MQPALPSPKPKDNNPQLLYLLSESAKRMTWQQWKKLGGCSLSGRSEWSVGKSLGKLPRVRYGWEKSTTPPQEEITLGELQTACIVAGREIARFGKYNLHLPDFAVIEYENI